jgi:serine/threonine protein kinase
MYSAVSPRSDMMRVPLKFLSFCSLLGQIRITSTASTSLRPRVEGHPIHATGQQVAAQDPFLVTKAGDVFEDRYQIFRKLGKGEYGSVWLAKQTKAKYALI